MSATPFFGDDRATRASLAVSWWLMMALLVYRLVFGFPVSQKQPSGLYGLTASGYVLKAVKCDGRWLWALWDRRENISWPR